MKNINCDLFLCVLIGQCPDDKACINCFDFKKCEYCSYSGKCIFEPNNLSFTK